MESIDLYTLDTILALLCPFCATPPLHSRKYTKEADSTTTCLISCLASLALTSRHVSAIATPHLYHQPSTAHWGLLLRTLIARPDLSARVSYLPARRWVPAGIGEQRVPPEVREYWVRQFPKHPSNGGVERLPGNSLAPLTALLCPNLRELDTKIDERDAILDINVLPAQHSALETLRTIAVSCTVHPEWLNLPRLENILSLAPNLERFIALVETDFHNWYGSRRAFSLIEHNGQSVDRRNMLNDFHRGTFKLKDWMTANFEVKQWEAVGFVMPGQSGLRLDRKGVVPFYELVEDPWCVRGLAERRELCTFSLDARCLLPHINPDIQSGFPPALVGEQRVSDEVLLDLLPSSMYQLRIVLPPGGPEAEDLGRALSRLVDVVPERFKSLDRVDVDGKGADVLQPWKARFEDVGVRFRMSKETGFVFHGYMGKWD